MESEVTRGQDGARVDDVLVANVHALAGFLDACLDERGLTDVSASEWLDDFLLGDSAPVRRSVAAGSAAEGLLALEADRVADLAGALHSVWLHGDWRWLTRNMTTGQREAAWAAVKRHSALGDPDGEPLSEGWAWWRDDAPADVYDAQGARRRCVKCGSAKATVRHEPADESAGVGERLVWRCEVCGFSWDTPTLDATALGGEGA